MNTKILTKSLIIILLLNTSYVCAQVFLQADNSDTAYGLLAAKGYGYEGPDCKHSVKHINGKWNSELKKFVFEFGMHRDLDDDRCINIDRQRIEILKNGATMGRQYLNDGNFV